MIKIDLLLHHYLRTLQVRLLTAIRDNVARDLAGPIIMVRHEAVAIRAFSDIARTPETNVNRYLDDHDLVLLGELDDDTLQITPQNRVLMHGSALRAALEAEARNPSQE